MSFGVITKGMVSHLGWERKRLLRVMMQRSAYVPELEMIGNGDGNVYGIGSEMEEYLVTEGGLVEEWTPLLDEMRDAFDVG